MQSSFIRGKLEHLEAVCRANGIPLTVQRRIIMETLAVRSDHPTADLLYEAVKDRVKGISRTTVYRVLETFVRFGIIQKISNPQAKARFDANTGRHHHIQCRLCGVVADIHDQDLNTLPLPTFEQTGFELSDYSINYTGTCARCLQRDGNNPTDCSERRNA